jgi:hypothetical protein
VEANVGYVGDLKLARDRTPSIGWQGLGQVEPRGWGAAPMRALRGEPRTIVHRQLFAPATARSRGFLAARE